MTIFDDTNILDALKWATTILFVTSDSYEEKIPPKVSTMLFSSKGLSFQAIAAEIPTFCARMEKSIAGRRERLEYQLRRAELLPDDDVPF